MCKQILKRGVDRWPMSPGRELFSHLVSLILILYGFLLKEKGKERGNLTLDE